MRLAELTVPELLALADLLLKIAEATPKVNVSEAHESVDEVKYILQLVREKAHSQGVTLQKSLN